MVYLYIFDLGRTKKGKDQVGREITPIQLSLQHLFSKYEKFHLFLYALNLREAIYRNHFFQHGLY